MLPGEVYSQTLLLDADQFLRFRVAQRGSEVRAALRGPDGEELIVSDATEEIGDEHLLWTTESPGRYKLEVSVEQPRGAGAKSELSSSRCFSVAQQDFRTATAEDRDRVRAFRLWQDGVEEKSEEKLEQAQEIWKRLGETLQQAQTMISTAELYENDDPRRTRIFFERAIQLSSDPVQRAYAHYGLSFTFSDELEWRPALDALTTASAYWQSIHGAEHWIAKTDVQAALMQIRLGRYTSSLELYRKAIELCEQGNFYRTKSIALSSRAYVDEFLHRWDHALEALNEAIEIRRKTGSSLAIPSIRRSMVHVRLGDFESAFRTLHDVLGLEISDRHKAYAWMTLGYAHSKSGKMDRAIEYFRRAGAVYEASGREQMIALTDYRLGQTYLAFHQPDRALVFFQQALQRYLQNGDLDGRAQTLSGIAYAQFDLDRLDEALQTVEEALNLVEELRAGSDIRDVQTQFFASRQHIYDLHVDLWMEKHRRDPAAGHHENAWIAGERSRARSLLQTIQESGGEIYSQEHQDLIFREKRTLEELREVVVDASSPVRENLHRETLRRLREDLNLIRSEIRRREPVYAAVNNPSILDVDQLQRQVLDEKTALLAFHLGEDASYLWYATERRFQSFRLPSAAIFKELTEDFQSLVDSPYPSELDQALAALTRALFGELEIDPEIERLIIVGDDVLQKFPFSILPLPGESKAGESASGSPPKLFVHQYEIIQPPSISVLNALRERKKKRDPGRGIMIVSPTTGIEGPNQESETKRSPTDALPTLPGADEEIRSIRDAYDREIMLLEGPATTKKRFLEEPLDIYRTIHIITHGEFNEFADETYLTLASDQDVRTDDRLHLREVSDLNITADLVVLSACETALGETIHGEGLLGMSYGFLYAGASSTIASLWKIPDQSTSELMKFFYERLNKQETTAAAALRSAQLRFLQAFPESQSPDAWGGFVIQGDF